MPVSANPVLAGPSTTCSLLAGAQGEPLAGTAPVATTWLCVEQPGPWGRDALLDSHLDSGLGRALAQRADGTGVRVALIRAPGRHPDRHRRTPRRVFLAHTTPGRSWLEQATVTDLRDLLDLNLGAAGVGVRGMLGGPVSTALLLVCTNGRRDLCCAVRGRPVAAALADEHAQAVWESSHLGGHRFAPTGLVLPSGYAYGRLDVAAARHVLAADTEVLVDRCRGRSTWEAPGQVAELAVREAAGVRGVDDLEVSHVQPCGQGRWQVTVRHTAGRRWRVSVTRRVGPATRPASCGAQATPVVTVTAGRPDPWP